jgi:hypothetical protein
MQNCKKTSCTLQPTLHYNKDIQILQKKIECGQLR